MPAASRSSFVSRNKPIRPKNAANIAIKPTQKETGRLIISVDFSERISTFLLRYPDKW